MPRYAGTIEAGNGSRARGQSGEGARPATASRRAGDVAVSRERPGRTQAAHEEAASKPWDETEAGESPETAHSTE